MSSPRSVFQNIQMQQTEKHLTISSFPHFTKHTPGDSEFLVKCKVVYFFNTPLVACNRFPVSFNALLAVDLLKSEIHSFGLG